MDRARFSWADLACASAIAASAGALLMVHVVAHVKLTPKTAGALAPAGRITNRWQGPKAVDPFRFSCTDDTRGPIWGDGGDLDCQEWNDAYLAALRPLILEP